MRKRQTRSNYARNDENGQERKKRGKTDDSERLQDITHIRGSARKKYAIFFGYIGKGFHGMQRQVNEKGEDLVRTVEGVLLKALLNCGAISPDQLENTERLQLSRVGRTDTGVHAACQVVSARIFVENKTRANNDVANISYLETNTTSNSTSTSNFVDRLQKELAGDEIEIFDVIRVKGGFDARHRADRRQYEYLLPTKFLRPLRLVNNEHEVRSFIRENSEDERKVVSYEEKLEVVRLLEKEDVAWEVFTEEGSSTADIVARWREEMDLLRKIWRLNRKETTESQSAVPVVGPVLSGSSLYPKSSLLGYRTSECEAMERFSDESLARLNGIMKQLEGNHHWMNFTSKMEAKSPSGYRLIEKVECFRAPQICHRAGEEVLVVRVIGQSFLLNQIRKMISICIETFLGSCPGRSPHLLANDSGTVKKHLHLAPASCLLLERAQFYNCEPTTSTDELGFYPLFEDIEKPNPFGPEVDNFVQRGVISRRRDLKPLDVKNGHNNLLLTDEQEDNDEGSSSRDPSIGQPPTIIISSPDGGQQGNNDRTSAAPLNQDELRVQKILRFKFNKLYPSILQGELEDWSVFLDDIQWHPFFLENFPKVRDRRP